MGSNIQVVGSTTEINFRRCHALTKIVDISRDLCSSFDDGYDHLHSICYVYWYLPAQYTYSISSMSEVLTVS